MPASTMFREGVSHPRAPEAPVRHAGERATRVLAVSVDPEGDTPPVVRSFLERRGVNGFVD